MPKSFIVGDLQQSMPEQADDATTTRTYDFKFRGCDRDRPSVSTPEYIKKLSMKMAINFSSSLVPCRLVFCMLMLHVNGRAFADYLQLAVIISTILLNPLGNDRILRGNASTN